MSKDEFSFGLDRGRLVDALTANAAERLVACRTKALQIIFGKEIYGMLKE